MSRSSLDGTPVDSVYQHVLAWKAALDAEGIELSIWRIHRKIGTSGGLFTNQFLRETGIEISDERVERLRRAHAAAYRPQTRQIRPLPGACELLAWLSEAGIPWAIATSGRMETAAVNLAALGVDPDRNPVVTRDQPENGGYRVIAALQSDRISRSDQGAIVAFASYMRDDDAVDANKEVDEREDSERQII